MTEWLLKGVCNVTINSNKLAVTDTIFKYKAIMKFVTWLFFPFFPRFTYPSYFNCTANCYSYLPGMSTVQTEL